MAGPNMDQFEAYFRRADLDGDGRITGAEAIAFFQGSNLSKPVLAQIWMHADQHKSGFLGRNEFYNALRLVTVAQSKRELTPDIVKAALFGPAAAKIPAPQINLAAVHAPQPSAVPTASMQQQMGSIAPTPSQNFGFRGPPVPNAGINQNYFPQQNQSIRPPQTMLNSSTSFIPQGNANQSNRPPQSMPNSTAYLLPQGIANQSIRSPRSMPSSTTSLLPQGIANQSIRPPQSMPSSTSSISPQGIANQSIRPPQSMPSSAFSLLPQGIANQSIRPPQSMPSSTFPLLPQGISGGAVAPNTPNLTISSDWLSGGTGAPPSEPRGMSPSMPTTAPKPQPSFSESQQPTDTDSKALVVSGNGLASTSAFGDLFSATSSAPREEPSRSTFSAISTTPSLATVPASIGPQTPSKVSSLDSLQSAFSMQPTGSQFHRPQSPSNPSQAVSAPGSSSFAFSGVSAGVGSSASDSPQHAWPKMKQSDIQKYMKVFTEVDTDRDGKITGEQARNLFLSWRLPREVLKQVWDLSDQDSDSMLSLREFCFALYLMERYREGHPLPPALPSNVVYDETLLSMTGQPKVPHGNPAWGPSPGFRQQQVMQGAQPLAPATGDFRPLVQASVPKADGALQSNQQKSSAPMLDDLFLSQNDNGRQKSEISKSQEPLAAEEKVEKTEKVILDSKEKIEFYRSKMQELVLYKSRCDNKLNEITERAHADKHEAESLAKKYEEKYKQVAEIASKLTVEEATFRDIQARKTEYQQAIVKMEQGGSADGILQVRADRIQYDIEELVKALAERCRKHGINIKSSAVIELPIGWEPGIQDGAAVWNEEWDKFEDEGFGNDLSINFKNASVPTGPQSVSVQNGITSPDRNSTIAGEHTFQNESAFIHSEDEYARSPHGSPAGRIPIESPSQEFMNHYGKGSEVDTETHRSFDESTWGAFDNNDDVDSVWGFNTSKSKDPDAEKHQDFFESDDFGVRPVRTGSPQAGTTFQKRSFSFDDSVPATPLSRFGNSPRYSEAGDFDNFSKFDSFSMHDSGLSPLPDRLSRFDSINSSKDFGQNAFSRFDSINSSRDFGQNTFSRFDSISSTRDFGNPTFSRIDSMSSTRDFGNPTFSRIDSMSSTKDFGQSHEKLTRFDSINSTKDFGKSGAFSFDDSDPFGSSSPFKVSSENQPTKKGSDNWSAF